jgi:hypothetical protein
VRIRHELIGFDEPPEGFRHQFFAFVHVVKDSGAQHEITGIHPHLRAGGGPELSHSAVRFNVREVEGQRWPDGEETGELAALLEALDHVVQVRVRETIGVVGQKDPLVLHMIANRPQPLADVAPYSRIDEGNAPVLLLLTQEFDIGTIAGHDAVSKNLRPVVQEELLDDVGFVAQCEYEILMSVSPVILDHVPENGLMAYGYHRLRNALRILANSGTEATAEEHDLHESSSLGSITATSGIGTMNLPPQAAT